MNIFKFILSFVFAFQTSFAASAAQFDLKTNQRYQGLKTLLEDGAFGKESVAIQSYMLSPIFKFLPKKLKDEFREELLSPGGNKKVFPKMNATVTGNKVLISFAEGNVSGSFVIHLEESVWLEINGKKWDGDPLANYVKFEAFIEDALKTKKTAGLFEEILSQLLPEAEAQFVLDTSSIGSHQKDDKKDSFLSNNDFLDYKKPLFGGGL